MVESCVRIMEMQRVNISVHNVIICVCANVSEEYLSAFIHVWAYVCIYFYNHSSYL